VIAPGGGGTTRLEEFSNRAINEYKEQRNFPSVNGTSQLSAALKRAIGIRTVWAATIAALENSRSDEVETASEHGSRTRMAEFYQHAMYNFPELATGAYRQVLKNFPYDNNEADFQLVRVEPLPIVDAAMRQMNEIGWMHNPLPHDCRQFSY